MSLSQSDFANRVDALTRQFRRGRISKEDLNRGRSALAEQYTAAGPDLATFETMLNKLTGSKMDQQGQLATARRGDIYAGGLANMMSNF